MSIQKYLPREFRKVIRESTLDSAEEIRLRAGQPLEILYADGKSMTFGQAECRHIKEMLNYLSGYSICALEEEIRQGFFTVEGGHRVGISGHTSYRKSGKWSDMNMISAISGLNIRIAHERKGCAEEIVERMFWKNEICHTFLFAPPGVGKTTYLRDCIRLLSNGISGHRGYKIGIVDERSEIAACHNGVPQNDLGPRVDVLDNCPKEQGMHMLLRSMSPEIIAVDELGLPEDFEAVAESTRSGVSVLGTIHAGNVCEVGLRLKKNHLKLPDNRTRLVELIREKSGRRKVCIYDGGGQVIWKN